MSANVAQRRTTRPGRAAASREDARAAVRAVPAAPETALVVEFTSSRARQRPLAARAGGVELPDGRLPLRAIDVDRHPDLRRRFGVNLLPTFIVLAGTSEVARFVGPHSRRELSAAIRRALDPRLVRLGDPPRPRGLWNDFSARLWGFSA